VTAGDIWWASVGQDVGSEINGKSRLFSRPVIIFKELAHGFYFVIPTSPRSGRWYVPFRQPDRKMIASLHQARAIDHRRLSTKLGQLDDTVITEQSFSGLVEHAEKRRAGLAHHVIVAQLPALFKLLDDTRRLSGDTL
jgi:mRNA-degrading endonuclease toxin of MazEF toxin-antitoxin module